MTKIVTCLPTFVASVLMAPALLLAAPASAQSPGQMQQLLARADTNGDGEITRAEFDRVRLQMFARLDRNGDGYVDAADRPRMFGDRFDQAYAMLSSLDTNGDRRIARAELANSKAPAFIARDTNGDNILSRTEIAALGSSR